MKLVKIGGSVLAFPTQLKRICEIINKSGSSFLIVPGGGPFADVVRDLDAKMNLSPTITHWMAILAMDQFALLLSDLLPNAQMLVEPRIIEKGLAIIRPSKFLESTDPLPHSWAVTSDSITAYFAYILGLRTILKITIQDIKQNSLQQLVDSYMLGLLEKYNVSLDIISIFDTEKIEQLFL